MRLRTIFLAAVAILAVLVGGLVYVALSGGEDVRRVGALGSYSSGARAVLLADGVQWGALRSTTCKGVVGAEATRQPAELAGKSGPDPKQIGKSSYEPCKFSFALGMEPAVYTWINDAMAGKASPKGLVIQYLNYDYKDQGTLDLGQVVIKEFSMPAMNAGNKDAGAMTITVAPQSLTYKPGTGAAVTSKATPSQKNWVPGTFRFDWGGEEASGVAEVSSFGFELAPESQRPLFREFSVSVNEAHLAPFEKFLKTFVLEGQNGPGYEKTATVTFLDSTTTITLATLTMRGVGMTEGQLTGGQTEAESIPRREYTLYAEGATFTIAP